MQRRKSSVHYQTFPTKPPSSRGLPPTGSKDPLVDHDESSPENTSSSAAAGEPTHNQNPLPTRQLIILAVISLAEQTALNSISPYLPQMAASFPGVDDCKVGVIVGVIASAFAAAQFATNFFWGRLSDRVGRKPVILLGTLLTCGCFLGFGFCETLGQAVVVQALMGAVNGNAGVVSTILGEITDKSNQSMAFAYLPIVYGIGGITGPIIGGVLVDIKPSGNGPIARLIKSHPYLAPNLVSAVVLLLDLVASLFFLEESLKEAKALPPLGSRVKSLFVRVWEFTASSRPSYLRSAQNEHDSMLADNNDEDDGESSSSRSPLFPEMAPAVSYRSILTPQIILLLITYFIFNLSNVAYNSLYPVFISTQPPTGRGLSPREIGLSLSFSAAATIIFQFLLFTPLQRRLGNRFGYTLALLGFVISFAAMPFVAYPDATHPLSKLRMWIEIGAVLLLKTIITVFGLTCAMLLITNSSPKASTLGTLNGLAQTLSAGGRAVGPLISGGLFTLGMKIKPRGELLAWGVFAGVAAAGCGLSLGVKGEELEGDEFEEGRGLLGGGTTTE